MKSIFLAAAAMIAVPAIAQDQPAPPADQTAPAPAADPAAPPPADPAMSAPAADPAAPPPPADSTMTTGTAPAATPPPGAMTAEQADKAGGYQPTTPPIAGGAPAAGATVRFQPAPDPNTAYPPPAPLAKYPVCKKGQYDKCRNPGGK